ncbi:hypothetical protein OG746_45345 [Streptomyces sp. NBC_01016]|uniref:hypothetical protein n=1 Tax=Streptomyces sp. NBC_01016 TaxID=2903720 RepID=UPI0022557341|nr:hypothetical protein [Streptomyces sp. NBC_01016]MCX4832315.1 hypothetical protein [Streptomyces sp. NBC_01016]MCX4835939.1 hypothetical protein [Streptomyces sp. NBC_01016]
MKLHMDGTDRVLLIALTILGIANATDSDASTGWRLWGTFMPAALACRIIRDARRKRRRQRAERQALLTRLDRLMRREVKRR